MLKERPCHRDVHLYEVLEKVRVVFSVQRIPELQMYHSLDTNLRNKVVVEQSIRNA